MHRRLLLFLAALTAALSATAQASAAASAHRAGASSGATGVPAVEAATQGRFSDVSLLSPAARRDYRAWLALGPGGLPANVGGWLVTTLLRPLSRETTSVAMYAGAAAPDVPLVLPKRAGDRPTIAPWPIPHRQTDQLPPLPHPAIEALPNEIAAEAPTQLRIATSKFERRGPAVFVNAVGARAPWARAARSEAGHVHASDGSLHLVLRPADAKVVIEAGWGERHPLSGVPLLGLPTNYLMVYAPRDDEELAVVRTLFRRATGG